MIEFRNALKHTERIEYEFANHRSRHNQTTVMRYTLEVHRYRKEVEVHRKEIYTFIHICLKKKKKRENENEITVF